MRLVNALLLCAAATLVIATAAGAASLLEEHVSGGALDRVWVNGFNTSNNMQPRSLAAGDAGYANPSGDHTVASLTNAVPDSGGIAVSLTDPMGNFDGMWEGWMFTGNGDTRRGLIIRADPSNNFQSFYQLVLYSGMSQIAFRKLVNGTPTTLKSWLTFTLPGGIPAVNTWHRIGIHAVDNVFRCFWDGTELTAGSPIVDNDLHTGWVGCYNFRFDAGGIPALFDDLVLSTPNPTATSLSSWGRLKALYVK